MDTVYYILRFLIVFIIMIFIIKIFMIAANCIGGQIVKFFQAVLQKIRK